MNSYRGDGSFQFTQEEYDEDMWKWVIKFLLTIVAAFVLFLLAMLPTSGNGEFPSCIQLQPPGDWAHYNEGWHQIAGNGLLWGQDDVYSWEEGYIQCYCSPGGAGVQTNWYPDEGGEEQGEDWNLEEGYYSYENMGYVCRESEPTPTILPTPTIWLTPTPTLAQVCIDCEENAQITPTPTRSIEPISWHQENGGAPVCVGQPVTKPPLYWPSLLERIDSDTVRVRWIPQDPHAQRYGVKYGMSKDSLSWYTEFPGTSDSGELNLVPPGHVWVEICSISSCGQRVCGLIEDP
mgnify:CR=1 FL=1